MSSSVAVEASSWSSARVGSFKVARLMSGYQTSLHKRLRGRWNNVAGEVEKMDVSS